MTGLVLDASVVVELLLRTPDADALAERLFGDALRGASIADLHVPHLLDIEVAQVIRRYAARGVLSGARGADALQLLEVLPLVRHAHRPLLPRVWALRENLTAYDATYVALAEALDRTLLTRDERLANAPGHRARTELV